MERSRFEEILFELSNQNETLKAHNRELREVGYVLSRLALQSHRYAHDYEYRDAVDNWIMVEKLGGE